MADNKFWNKGDDNFFEELSLDNLEEVSGGRIKPKGYVALEALMWQMKQLGKSKEDCLKALQHGWDTDAKYKTDFTDGTDEDYQKSIAYIENHW